MNRNFTRSQLLALDISQEKNVAVSASAGTGKTTVLVERFSDCWKQSGRAWTDCLS